MKRLLFIVSLFVCCMTCTNDDEQKNYPASGAGGNVTADTSSRGDTASYERMPQQTIDSTGK